MTYFLEFFICGWVRIANIRKLFGREGRDVRVRDALGACVDSVSDSKMAGIVDSYHISREGFFDGFSVLGEQALSGREVDGLS